MVKCGAEELEDVGVEGPAMVGRWEISTGLEERWVSETIGPEQR